MSAWDMDDGSALTGTHTFTNADATVTGSGSAYTTELAVGDIIISAGGVKGRVLSIASDTSLELTANFSESTESGVAATRTRPPHNFDSAFPHIDSNILGITTAEAEAGFDNIVSLAPLTTGSGYGSAPTVTVAAPAVRTIPTSAVNTSTEVITLANHGFRTGMKLKYQDGGGTALAGLTDNTDYFMIRVDADTFKVASSLSNANAGTAINLTGTGNNAQTFEGIQATGTAVLSGGHLASITLTEAGTDYQTVPTVTIAAPAEVTFNAASAVDGTDITLSSHPFVTGDQVTYSDKGGTAIAELTDGGTFFIIKSDANTVQLASSLNNANAGTAISLTDGPSENHGLTGVTATATAAMGAGDVFTDANASSEITHVGWVKKTVGTGGRAGRVFYETLVAASSISGDADDDASAPDS
jgi:hypothetical protein